MGLTAQSNIEHKLIPGKVPPSELWGWTDCSPTLAPLPPKAEHKEGFEMLEETMVCCPPPG